MKVADVKLDWGYVTPENVHATLQCSVPEHFTCIWLPMMKMVSTMTSMTMEAFFTGPPFPPSPSPSPAIVSLAPPVMLVP